MSGLGPRSAFAAALALLATLGGPAAARAADPVMPLSEVRAGMRCTGLSVVRGTEVSAFDVEVLDVVHGQPLADGPAILLRVSGPAVDATGIGPGFSGSPVMCPDATGTPRNAGAIAYGVGEYGNKVALATPIEAVLGEAVEVPSGARRAPKAIASARSLAGPLTVTGLRPALAARLGEAARRHGRAFVAAPTAPLGRPSGGPLRPGSAVGVGLVSGDVAVGAVGTVSYVDGSALWAFGHPLEAAGARALMLQDAYVYGVVNNPAASAELGTYKLAAPGRTVGTLTNDALAAVVGRVGAPPRRIPLRVAARDLDTGATRDFRVEIADESPLAAPGGLPVLTLAGAMTLLQADASVLRGTPYHLTSVCVRFRVRQLPKPFGYCNRYSGGGEGAGGHAEDYAVAAAAIEGYRGGRLRVTDVSVKLAVRRGVHDAELVDAAAPRRVRPGQRVPVTLTVQRPRGERERVRLTVRVPSGLRAGRRTLTLRGASAAQGSEELGELLFEGGAGGGAASPEEVAALVGEIGREDGVRASFGGGARAVYRDPGLLITGRARVLLRVARP